MRSTGFLDMFRGISRVNLYIAIALVVTFSGTIGLVAWIAKNSSEPKPQFQSSLRKDIENDTVPLDLDDSPAPSAATTPPASTATGTARLIATGDFIAHDALNARAKSGDTYDYYQFMKDMQPVVDGADATFCNQSTPAGGESFGLSGYPVFNAPLGWVDSIAKLKCTVVNTASNHSNDKGQGVIDANVTAWKKYPDIVTAGQNSSKAEQDTIRYFKIGALNAAFITFTTYSNSQGATPHGVNMYSKEVAAAQIAEAKKKADYIVVSMRWGTEYSQDVNGAQDGEAQYLADQGADIIIGHGPHVLQPVKRLARAGGGETLVWFSMGNFFHAQLEPETLVNCVAVMDIDLATKKVANVGCLPVFMYYDWPAGAEASGNLLARDHFRLLLAENAKDIFPASSIGKKTTLQAQLDRLKTVTNKFTEVKQLTAADYGL